MVAGERIILVVNGSSFGGLFVGVVLLLHFLAHLTFTVAVHHRLVLVDAVLCISGGVDTIIDDDQPPAEGLSKKTKEQQKSSGLPEKHR